MIIRFTPEADAELAEASRWYAHQREDLDIDFMESIDDALSRIVSSPDAYPIVYRTLRRAVVRRFPFAVFYEVTADEIWESIPVDSNSEKAVSVHLSDLPVASPTENGELLAGFAHVFMHRDHVLAKLEEARVSKLIGSSLEAKVRILAGSHAYRMLDQFRDQLRYIFIVSQVDLSADATTSEEGIRVTIEKAEGQKCERCWNYSTHVGESEQYLTVCERCVVALEEMEKEAA